MSTAAASPPPAPQQHDREKTPPFLLKLFYRQNDFHRLEEFVPGSQLPRHLQIYTWPSCTLKELTHLLTSAMPNLLPSPAAGTRIAFRLVFPDTRPGGGGNSGRSDAPGRFMTRDLGSVVVGESGTSREETNGNDEDLEDKDKSGRSLDGDAEKMLQDAKFVIGDYVSCAIIPPLHTGRTAPPPGGPRYGSHSRPGPPPPRGGGSSYRGGGGGGPRSSMRAFPSNGDYHHGGPNGNGGVPMGDWRRGERLPDGPSSYGGPPPDMGYGRRSRPRW